MGSKPSGRPYDDMDLGLSPTYQLLMIEARNAQIAALTEQLSDVLKENNQLRAQVVTMHDTCRDLRRAYQEAMKLAGTAIQAGKK